MCWVRRQSGWIGIFRAVHILSFRWPEAKAVELIPAKCDAFIRASDGLNGAWDWLSKSLEFATLFNKFNLMTIWEIHPVNPDQRKINQLLNVIETGQIGIFRPIRCMDLFVWRITGMDRAYLSDKTRQAREGVIFAFMPGYPTGLCFYPSNW